MPLPRSFAHFNRIFTNRVFAPLAGRVPPWVLVEHRGRRSGRLYQTVVWAFPHADDLVLALTYGSSSDWVRNVLAAGGCRVEWRGRWRSFSRAQLVEGAAGLRLLPGPLPVLLRLGGVKTVLHLSSGIVPPGGDAAG